MKNKRIYFSKNATTKMTGHKKLVLAVLLVLLVSISGYIIWNMDIARPWTSLLQNEIGIRELPDLDSAVIIPDDGFEYIPVDEIPLGRTDNFDARDKSWWEKNVGVELDENTVITEVKYEKDLVINQSGYEFLNKDIIKTNIDEELLFYVNGAQDVFFKNSYLESAIYVYSNNRTTGNVILENCTFKKGSIIGVCVGGMSVTATNNYFTSFNDAINVDGGLSGKSTIAYNWLDGPGYRVGENHNDGVQFWREGYTDIYRNRIGGYSNSCVTIHSCAPPRYGTEPISYINIKENYFENNGLTWYYLYVCESAPDATVEYLTRPRYITITDNWFEDKAKFPLFSGERAKDRAMFVRTEEERMEGIERQEIDPSVLDYRKSFGYAKTAVDARTWIVWNNNRWVEDGSEVDPSQDGWAGGMKGWYDLTLERQEYPDEVAALPSSTPASDIPDNKALSVQFVEDSANGNYPSWTVTNHTDKNVSVYISLPGNLDQPNVMKPGENTVRTRKAAGENSLIIRWTQNGNEQELQSFGLDYAVQHLTVAFDSASSTIHNDAWNVHNPNGFLMQGSWKIEGTSQNGTVWLGANATVTVHTKTDMSANVFTLSWADENGNIVESEAHKPAKETPAITTDNLSIKFDDESANGNYPTWIVQNSTDQNISITMKLPGQPEQTNVVRPGDNIVRARKIPGVNILVIKWMQDATERTIESFGVDYMIQDLTVEVNTAESTIHNTYWRVSNPNGFLLQCSWSISGINQAGTAYVGANSSTNITTKAQTGISTLTITWQDENGNTKVLETNYNNGPPAESITTPLPVPMP